ncbi:hypothetical protein CJ030_MR1G005470 [Morella rubra]|uniref:RNase H type-1 domain-containing protein n=1 Tax=Morella rubra TaxID=262757 RepID=A0A6A1WKV6_9ROSI|nr:hypothetical protein CJ030_MR1G005470 [Morella rubra]
MRTNLSMFRRCSDSLAMRFVESSAAWLVQDSTSTLCWVPPGPNQLKINFEVAIRQSGSYIAVSCRDSSSSLYTAYMEQIRAMDPLLGEAMAAARAVELAQSHQWQMVIFETDLKLLWEDISDVNGQPCWKIADIVVSLRLAFKAQSTWSIHWVPRKLNQQAHLLLNGLLVSIFLAFSILVVFLRLFVL